MQAVSSETQVISKKIKIQNRRGLHARAAAKMTTLAGMFQAEVFVQNGDKKVSALSLMGLLLLTAHAGTEIELHASGTDSAEAIRNLESLIKDKFHEAD